MCLNSIICFIIKYLEEMLKEVYPMGKVLSKNITAVATIILFICLFTSFGNSFCNKEVANALSSWTVLTTSRFELTGFTLLITEITLLILGLVVT